MKKILIAGATGYLGSYVTQEFKSRGYFVRALARSPEKLVQTHFSLDEIIKAEVTQPQSIEGVCNGIDVVFSSFGITSQKSNQTFRDVDYQGNKNLLDEAIRTGVKQFIYVSVFNIPSMRNLEIVKAHEDFVDELKASGINYTIIRPTGYFSDMAAFLKLARKGRTYVIGSGAYMVNPIHGADLAKFCVDALGGNIKELDVGGPKILTHWEISEIAFRVLGKPARISSFPRWLMKAAVATTKLFNKHQGALLDFFTIAMTSDLVAPLNGSRTLEAYFQYLEKNHEHSGNHSTAFSRKATL